MSTVNQIELEKTNQKQKEVIGGLEITNEKLRRRVQYYEHFLENVAQFEKSQNVMQFKEFVSSNIKTFESLIEELYQVKEGKVAEYITAYETRMKAEEASATLDKENINIAGKTSGVGIASSNPRSATTEHQMKTMQKQIDFLSKEVEDLTERNKRYSSSLNKKDFFHEYEMLLKEVQGLRKQNAIVNEKLRAKMQE